MASKQEIKVEVEITTGPILELTIDALTHLAMCLTKLPPSPEKTQLRNKARRLYSEAKKQLKKGTRRRV